MAALVFVSAFGHRMKTFFILIAERSERNGEKFHHDARSKNDSRYHHARLKASLMPNQICQFFRIWINDYVSRFYTCKPTWNIFRKHECQSADNFYLQSRVGQVEPHL